MNLKVVTALFLLTGCAFGGTRPANNQTSGLTPLAIVNAILVDLCTGKETPDTVILIQGHKIERVGTPAQVPVPSDALVVDAT